MASVGSEEKSEDTSVMSQSESNDGSSKRITRSQISPNVLAASYAVRGAIVVRAGQIREELKSSNNKYPFDKIIMCNIGNPQALGQIPLTFHRQVLAACLSPDILLDSKKSPFAKDVIARAKKILDNTASNTIGAYTHSQGFSNVRQTVCDFIAKRDNIVADKSDINYPNINNIFLTDGASSGIKIILQTLIYGRKHGVLLPIPQYPLYSASVSLLNGTQIPYYLNESNGWSFEINKTQEACKEAKNNGIDIKAIVVINPGNPTGQCLSEKDIKNVIELAKQENLVILADEVYQENIYGDKPFISFRKVLKSMGNDYNNVELCSFHSVSKGILGECGLRGGYMELCNISQDGISEIYKLASINLCPNTIGQITVDLMCNPPSINDESYQLYKKEYNKQYESLKYRASLLSSKLNDINGISCQTVNGAMYAFPTIELPKKLIEYAKNKLNRKPDEYYCLKLLENTGICVVPGSGFGQKDGTFHLRTTILPPQNEIEQVIDKLAKFHSNFIKEWQ